MNEDELRQAMSALEVYRIQLQSIAENMQLIQISLEELARARETLSQYKSAEIGSDILVPIGGNSFVFAKASDNTKAIVGIGSGISLEKSMEDAIKTMEERSNELTESIRKLSERRQALEAQAEQLSRTIQSEMQALQGQ
ncbi:MAG TPA: prefoldin subunit alpha [Methanomassiliicoccaceae archaeon]|jgi:prefoldin alpha subunit|nr:prefoldin subunit alpha [Euryarchaeota archaeon]HOB38494.1 prefoldin subunit alpha [Methanomassiliicoccaceae archaeon]HOQ25150.1 prefoldin subunit alpha [Methanomassiliicoccaceae archaeon]HPT74583.1 prefoldin subunit alpha [Methanomassiliicoccaceae archaeon]HQA21705.1 prefoldin subunit alpha [Methanomassiliicoccaceae archaeon]